MSHSLEEAANLRQSPADAGVHFLDLLAVLLLGWKTIVLCVVGAILLAIGMIAVRPESYSSSTVLLPATSEGDAASVLIAAQLPAGLPGLAGLGNSSQKMIGAILASRSLADSMVARIVPAGAPKEQEALVRHILNKRTDMTTEPDGSIIIEVVAPDPDLAVGVAAEFPHVVNAIVSHINAQTAGHKKDFLEGQLAQAREELIQAEEALVNFQVTREVPTMGEQAARAVEAAALLQQEIIQRELQVIGLRRTATEENPQLQAAIADLEARKAQLRRMTGVGSDAGSAAPFLGSPELQTSAGRLLREFRSKEQIHDVLAAGLADASIDAENSLPVVSVLDSAQRPDEPRGVNMPLILGLVAVAGFLFAVLLVLMREYARHARVDPRHRALLVAWEQVRRELVPSKRAPTKAIAERTVPGEP
jgi:capsule polysaccharide export protein KpsE/RkpR